jgi:indole-3-glycerol phosphate synthase
MKCRFLENPFLEPLQFGMTILETIVEKKRERLSSAKYRTSLTELKSLAGDIEPARDFYGAIKRRTSGIRIIAEIKRASPSKGLIRASFDHRAIASLYEEKKVNAVSVITEEDFFGGRLDFLSDVRKATTRPVLRKDFIFDEYQIYEARAHGADAFLLIAGILDIGQAAEYLALAQELGMAVLFEVHDHAELEKALTVNAPVIGVNNRNLGTLTVDLATSLTLKKEIPKDRIVVSESGIQTREDVLKVESAGIDAILVGTCLMESPDIGAKLDQLTGKT